MKRKHPRPYYFKGSVAQAMKDPHHLVQPV